MATTTIPLSSRAPRLAPAAPARPLAVPPDWRHGLPALAGRVVTLRELLPADSAQLLPLLTAPEVVRFLSPPPQSLERFQWFIESTARERAAGRYAGFAVVPHGHPHPVGLVQVRQLEPAFRTAEWGVALGSAFWGSGVFADAARLLFDFAFDVLGVHRLEARVAVPNARGNGAMEKMGAVPEGLLRRSLVTPDGSRVDQVLWSVLEDEWRARVGGRREDLSWVH